MWKCLDVRWAGIYSYPDSNYSDLWHYNITTNEWAWINGSNSGVWSPGNYGVKTVSSPANNPGSYGIGSSWQDLQGALWMFVYGSVWRYIIKPL